MNENAKTYPQEAFRFLAAADISGADGGQAASKERSLTGIAYSGGVVTDHGWWDRLAIDLDSLSLNPPIPLLDCHNQSNSVGIVTAADTSGGNLSIHARLFADIEPGAAQIAAKADKGFPWQLSVGIWPDSIEEVKAGATVAVNGRDMPGPLAVFRGGTVREVSLVSVAADRQASASILNAGANTLSIKTTTHEDNTMAQDPKIAELEAEIAALRTKNAELSAHSPDPSKFAPIEALHAAMAENATLKKAQLAADIDGLVKSALADGRLLPGQEEWARELGAANLAALQKFIATAQPVAALQGTQTGGKPPSDANNPLRVGFTAPDNMQVDPSGLALHAKAKHYQAQHGGDYLSAIRALAATI